MLNQKEGTYQAIEAVLAENGKTIEHGVKVDLTDSEKSAVVEILTNGFFGREIQMKPESFKKHSVSKQAMTKYVGGLLKNWLAKDKRLNGNVDHEIKNPGARAGQGDQVVKELRKLRATLTNQEEIAAVDSEIEKRMEKIQAEKQKAVEINADLIPDDLKHLVAG